MALNKSIDVDVDSLLDEIDSAMTAPAAQIPPKPHIPPSSTFTAVATSAAPPSHQPSTDDEEVDALLASIGQVEAPSRSRTHSSSAPSPTVAVRPVGSSTKYVSSVALHVTYRRRCNELWLAGPSTPVGQSMSLTDCRYLVVCVFVLLVLHHFRSHLFDLEHATVFVVQVAISKCCGWMTGCGILRWITYSFVLTTQTQ